MNKCDFCFYSYKANGDIRCSSGGKGCLLTKEEYEKLMKQITEIRRCEDEG